MSVIIQFRCLLCTLYNQKRDIIVHVHKLDAKNHIYIQHSYEEKIKAARCIKLILKNEVRSANWLTDKLMELSIYSKTKISLSQNSDLGSQ